ncbi:tetratricopeptide repeat protein [Magnetofaba australis]|uniref:tetratricopeptide repeat protein n=1 Tax=Magnetofaba australis TaxID=1472297 RepID=UPI001301C156|nr:tetratricopeptide repeat protein [Magnetofaba australis]
MKAAPYLQAAKAGDAQAQFQVGEIYLTGPEPQHLVEAAQWFHKAAEQGHAAAQASLGVLYYAGVGVKEDNAEAVKWFQEAAVKHHADAQYHLGLMYEQGSGIKANLERALKWYDYAAGQGHVAAAKRKLALLNKISPDKAKEILAANQAQRDTIRAGQLDEDPFGAPAAPTATAAAPTDEDPFGAADVPATASMASNVSGQSADQARQLAQQAESQRHWEDAVAEYQRAIAITLDTADLSREQQWPLIGRDNAAIKRIQSRLPAWVDERLAKAAQLSPSAAAAPQMGAWQAALGQGQQGDLAAAKQAVTLAQKLFGADHPYTLASRKILAKQQFVQGDFAPAQSALQQIWQTGQKVLGVDHPETLDSAGMLADLYETRSQYAKALDVRQKIAEQYAAGLGREHPLTLATQRAMARLQQNLGQLEEAAITLEQTCTATARTLGAWHPDSAACLAQQGRLALQQGDYAAAGQKLEAARDKMVRIMPLDDARTVETRLDLADWQMRRGDLTIARSNLDELAKLTESETQTLGDLRAKTLGLLAQVQIKQGQLAQAEPTLKNAYDTEIARKGAQHPDAIAALSELAGLYKRMGRFAEAEITFQNALADARTVLGPKHQTTLALMNNLGLTFEEEGLFDQAEPLFLEALKGLQESLGEGHPDAIAALNSLALLYESQGVFDRAEPLYQQAIRISSERLGPDHPDTMAFLNNLGYLQLMRQDYAAAEPIFQKAFDIWRKSLGDAHPTTFKSLNNLARVERNLGKLDRAEAHFKQALAGRRQALGPQHIDTLRSMHDLAALYRDQKRYKEADKLLRETLDLDEKILGPQHPYTFETLNTLAAVQEETNALSEAFKLRKEATERRTQFLNRMMWVTGDNAREGYTRLHRPELNAWLDLLTRLPDAEQAGAALLETSLQRKGLLFKITSQIRQIAQVSNDPKLRKVTDELAAARRALASLTLAGPQEHQDPKAHLARMHQLESKIHSLEGEVGRASLRFRESATEVTLDKIAEHLPDGAALVDFLIYADQSGGRHLLAGVMTRDGDALHRSLVCYEDLDAIEKLVLDYRAAIQDDGMDEDELLELGMAVYAQIWEPLTEALGEERERVFLAPDGVLNILPFNALVTDEELYLIEAVDLHILTTSRDLLPTRIPRADGGFITLAGPNYDTDQVASVERKGVLSRRSGSRGASRGFVKTDSRAASLRAGLRAFSRGMRGLKFDPLPGAEKEGELIVESTQAAGKNNVLLLRNDAQEERVKQFKQPPQVLHIATHGFFLQADDSLKKRLLRLQRSANIDLPPPGDNPMLRAGLAFAGINANAPFLGEIDTRNDGVLTALEVLDLNLQGTQLAVLSACETGLGEVHEGEGVYGLRRAFQEAGVNMVMASLWEVSDDGTQAMMNAMYERLMEGKSAHDALREAQLALIRDPRFGYPYIWSAFMSIGH